MPDRWQRRKARPALPALEARLQRWRQDRNRLKSAHTVSWETSAGLTEQIIGARAAAAILGDKQVFIIVPVITEQISGLGLRNRLTLRLILLVAAFKERALLRTLT